jgi:excisionase family DNA binding protein
MTPAAFGHSILISKKTAASLLGISIGMIEKLVRLKKLEPVRLGRKVLFRRADIEELALTPSQRRTFSALSGKLVH